jgi:hypothetical protein
MKKENDPEAIRIDELKNHQLRMDAEHLLMDDEKIEIYKKGRFEVLFIPDLEEALGTINHKSSCSIEEFSEVTDPASVFKKLEKKSKKEVKE